MKQVLFFIMLLAFLSCTKEEEVTTKQSSAIPDEVCIRCQVIQGVITGGNSALLPPLEDFCGTPERVDSFETNYWQRYQVWIDSWQWQGSGYSDVNCDRY